MNKALSPKNVKHYAHPQKTTEGAGVRLQRVVGTASLPDLDPFLLLDHFGSENPDDYVAGFPTHPHRGIETVTYMLRGRIRHGDSVGNSGTIEAGGVQWMTAGSGIMHEEMPELEGGRLEGFQLWVNLPAAQKMTRPRYQEFAESEIPVVADEGFEVRVIAGSFRGTHGAVSGIAGAPTYLDVCLNPGDSIEVELVSNNTAFCYLYRGSVLFEGETGSEKKDAPILAVYGEAGEVIDLSSGEGGASLLLIGGNPLNEPVARYGPFVMNSGDEIETALNELREGTFIKRHGD